jgi:hypothetical protein
VPLDTFLLAYFMRDRIGTRYTSKIGNFSRPASIYDIYWNIIKS